MYYFLFAFLLVALFFCTIFHFRKKKIIKKVKCMEKCDKCSLLEELANPMGYCYYCNYGIFSSTLDAWQKKAGYTYLYDYMAPRFQMVFDALPVYFDYDGKTWLMEFWKGQYGINTGAEIGIYHSDRIIPENDYRETLFDSAADSEMLNCSFTLRNNGVDYLKISRRHWWLTAFLPGCFTMPSSLSMEITLSFPNREMLSAFADGLYKAGYSPYDVSILGFTITFTFAGSDAPERNMLTRFRRRYSQWKNKLFCRLYIFITRPFSNTEDRILYLYYYLPAAFRNTLRLHRFNKRCHRKRQCMRKRI